jgi:hypothetical protein
MVKIEPGDKIAYRKRTLAFFIQVLSLPLQTLMLFVETDHYLLQQALHECVTSLNHHISTYTLKKWSTGLEVSLSLAPQKQNKQTKKRGTQHYNVPFFLCLTSCAVSAYNPC